MIQILIVDDQHIIRQGVKSMLECYTDLQVIGEAENGQQAISMLEGYANDRIATIHPDIVLLDIRMPVMDGVAATKIICQSYPQTKVIVLTTFDDDEYVSQAVRLGAKGYLLKDTEPAEIAAAIRAVYKGHTQLGPGLLEKVLLPEHIFPSLPPELARLTPRELEVLKLIASGANNREIANTLFLSENTVKNYVTNILDRLNVRDRTQAALLARSL